MGKLRQAPSRLARPISRLTFTATDAQGPAPVQQSAPWRAWYNTSRWRSLRQDILVRDCYACQMCGRLCAGSYPSPDSPVVDHKAPHRGDERLFWAAANLQTVCASCHNGAKQAQEQGTLHQRGMWA